MIALRFYATGNFLQVIGDTFGVDAATVSRVITSVTEALFNIKDRVILFPVTDVARNTVKRGFFSMRGFPGVVGCIDGTHVRIISPPKDEEAAYVNRKHYHSINVQATVDHLGLEKGVLLGDSGYPCRPFLLTPYLNPSSASEERYNEAHTGTRNLIERVFGVWKRKFHVLHSEERNERLFYRIVMQNVELMMPIIYTPTVGQACLKYGLTLRKPRGLYITIHDLGHIYDILCNWNIEDIKAIVVTDGERILGLGDLGSFGMGIPVGKLALYTALAGVQPHQCLPIMIDVGTNNETLLNDPLYIGLKQKRERGPKYDQLIDEFMNAVVKRYGGNCLVQFEDFGNHNAFRLLEKYRDSFCTFNDDIQGTASVTVAGLMASLRITGKALRENVFVFQGAGEASIRSGKLLIMALKEEGCTEKEAYSKIWMVDSRGLIVKDRPAGGVTDEKVPFAHAHAPIDKLEDVVKEIKPTAIIGAAAVPGAFTETILRSMAESNEHPVIFALSNPTSKAECTAEQAYKATKGKCVFASGSPFNAVTLDGKTYHPGQGNNAYIFPAVGLATVACDVRTIPESVFLESAKALAGMVTKENLAEGRVYPPLADIRKVSTDIAVHLAEFAYKEKLAHHFPEPRYKRHFIESHQYNTDYEDYAPPLYSWLGHDAKM